MLIVLERILLLIPTQAPRQLQSFLFLREDIDHVGLGWPIDSEAVGSQPQGL